MSSHTTVEAKLRELVRRDPRYTIEAYHFVFEALDFAMMRTGKHRRRGSERHLSVDELLVGIRDYALGQYGPLARVVLETIGIYATEDLGEVVFNLVDEELLNKQEEDEREKFTDVFSFREAFDERALEQLGSLEI